jgi:hypothetical protein
MLCRQAQLSGTSEERPADLLRHRLDEQVVNDLEHVGRVVARHDLLRLRQVVDRERVRTAERDDEPAERVQVLLLQLRDVRRRVHVVHEHVHEPAARDPEPVSRLSPREAEAWTAPRTGSDR